MIKVSLFTILLFLLIGCSTPNAANMNSAVTPTTSISIVASPTTFPSPTVSVISRKTGSEVNMECIEITSPPENKSGGVLVLQKGLGGHLTLVENETGNQKAVPADPSMKVWGAYVSPNAKWLMYQLDWGDPNGETKFIVTKADGVTEKEIPYYGDWGWSSIFWLNDSALRVAETDNAVAHIDNFAFDPFTEAKILLRSDLPLIANNRNIDWFVDRQALELGIVPGSNIIFDPTLSRVLYPKVSESVSLFNLENDQEIVRQSIPGWGRLPKWSWDGQYLAIVSSMGADPKREELDELLVTSRDGPEFRQITYLTSFFKTVRIEDYSWSPDGTQIALWLKTDKSDSAGDENSFELAVLDLQTGNTTNYCITGISSLYDGVEFITYALPIIWSPDSTQLLITRRQDNDKHQSEVIIVDIVNKLAYKVAENMQPIGWMMIEP